MARLFRTRVWASRTVAHTFAGTADPAVGSGQWAARRDIRARDTAPDPRSSAHDVRLGGRRGPFAGICGGIRQAALYRRVYGPAQLPARRDGRVPRLDDRP